ncbi:hypothetical protein ATY75_12095 [Rhizobium sp. N122]|uniref:hypothetical protein n=1 Tax=Rhizobium sp. N122 TaxID=1764272 RepID=UPI000B5A55CB|nr:hypothetical protein [Rhizobium sp. N122]OWV62558.1 hypothetical protein ATY75_12095 [Rhizobium sp. N122]
MIVWGIDASSKCGLAIWDTDRDLASVHCEVIEVKGESNHYWFAAQMGRILRARVERFGMPDLLVIEQGSHSTQGTGVNGVIWAWNCIGAVMAFSGICEFPIATIHHDSWRKPFYGAGFVCPQEPVMETVEERGQRIRRQVIEKGKPKFKNDWKTAAIQKCERDGVTLPPQKTIAHNAAEAVGIAHSWVHSTPINEEFHAAFKAMKLANGDREANLFSAGKLRSQQRNDRSAA